MLFEKREVYLDNFENLIQAENSFQKFKVAEKMKIFVSYIYFDWVL